MACPKHTLKGLVVMIDLKGYVGLTLLSFLVTVFSYHLSLEFIKMGTSNNLCIFSGRIRASREALGSFS